MARETADDGPLVNTVVEDGETQDVVAPVDAPVEAPPVTPPEPVRQGLLKITVKQYSQARGIRWERAAGFLYWAQAEYGPGHRLTVPEWTHVHETFLNRRVR
ncbi:MAG: hypothetical protein KJN79_01190 [Gammaproteobacteria bacterium]|nr:hypothetical protein [Gammaproteobacteria bacterium]